MLDETRKKRKCNKRSHHQKRRDSHHRYTRGGKTGKPGAKEVNSKIPRCKQKYNSMIKSPSDTTLYKPAMQLRGEETMINKISNFIEGIRINNERSRSVTPGEDPGDGKRKTPAREDRSSPSMSRDIAGVVIQNAEKFKVDITAPKGNDQNTILDISATIPNMLGRGELLHRGGENDDDFFHITCHIEQNLTDKIQKGEFVDLEKLLPKDRGGFRSEEKRFEIVSKEGVAYLTPAQDKNNRISSVRKWEQAFRVYTAIYSKANPQRASEIWQYIYVTNLAATSYNWENVAFYDYTFRQLMSQKPNRSWAKTYVQGWNLAMTEPLVKPHAGKFGHNNNNANQGGKTRDWRDDCCWKFNKNKCNRGKECNWDHRCTYCGGWYHSFANCRKRLHKEGNGKNGPSPRKSSKK